MRYAGYFAALLMCHAPSVMAQNAVNVSVETSSDDGLGKVLASALREKVNRSSLLSLVYGDKVGLRAKLVTLDPDSGPTQNRTIYSFVVTLRMQEEGLETYLTSSVGTCGRIKIDSCAEEFKGTPDEWADGLRQVAASSR